MKIASKPILMVEDDQVDAMTVKRALKELHVTNPLVHRENGEAALAHLRDPGSEKPCIILLDLNMPLMNGIEFLQVIKQDEIPEAYPGGGADHLGGAAGQGEQLRSRRRRLYGQAGGLPPVRRSHALHQQLLDHQRDAGISGFYLEKT